MKKKCTKCELELELSDFYKDKKQKSGYYPSCKSCCGKYYVNNKEKVLLYRKTHSNPEYQKTYYKNNLDSEKKRLKKWREDNPFYYKNYRENNIHIFAWRDVLKNSLTRLGKEKEDNTIDLLGYSSIELKIHIEKLFTDGMSWDNYGEWHIDHIVEVRKFNKNTLPNIVNALSNLRPLWATTREINGVIYEGNLNRRKNE